MKALDSFNLNDSTSQFPPLPSLSLHTQRTSAVLPSSMSSNESSVVSQSQQTSTPFNVTPSFAYMNQPTPDHRPSLRDSPEIPASDPYSGYYMPSFQLPQQHQHPHQNNHNGTQHYQQAYNVGPSTPRYSEAAVAPSVTSNLSSSQPESTDSSAAAPLASYRAKCMYYNRRTSSYDVLSPRKAEARVRSGELIPSEQTPCHPPSITPGPMTNSKGKTKRSRGGCLTCRQRKKRCCETKPVCAECMRLSIRCRWPVPGSEHKNRSKNHRMPRDEIKHEVFGVIKILRGVVDYKVED